MWPNKKTKKDQPPTCDLTDLKEMVDHDTGFIIELLHLFINNTESHLRQLSQFCQQGKWQMAGAIAHKLIPGCSHLRLHQMERTLAQIEARSFNNPDSIEMGHMVNEVREHFKKLKPSIELEILKLKKHYRWDMNQKITDNQ